MIIKRMLSSDVINMNLDYAYRVMKNPINFLNGMNYKKIDFNKNKIIDKKIGFKIFKKNKLLNTDNLVLVLKKWLYCPHYGSGAQGSKERVTLVIHFTCLDTYSSTTTKKYQDFNIAPQEQLKKDFWLVGCQ